MTARTRSGKKQTGFSLIEILVALLILSIGMLGIAQLLLLTHKTNSSSYIRQQATQSAYDIFDRINTNRQAAINGNYTVNNLVLSGSPSPPSTPTTNCDNSVCNEAQMAAYDIWYWLTTDVAQLPNGCGSITTSASGINTIVTVTVQWDDSPAEQALGATTTQPAQLTIQSQL